MKKIVLSIAIVIFFAGALNLTAQNTKPLKIGVVDVETILKELPDAQQADKDLKLLSQSLQDSLINMQKQLEEKYMSYEKQKSMMTPEQQQQAEAELQQMQMQALQFREAKFGQQGELVQRRMQFLEPLREKIMEAIQKVAAAENINIVLDKSNASVLYAEEKFDITFRVLDELKRGE